ncbi:MAG: ParA family protein [Proteobacteria bacterium]|nr:ParA family protein [Pseudomonadota bacterium]
MKTFAILNQKGGTGKTTITMNLAAQLAALGQRVLVADVDPQGNSTSGSGVEKQFLVCGMYEVLSGVPAKEAVAYCLPYRYHLLAASRNLAGAEIELSQEEDWRTRLRDALLPLADDFDYVFIDCPPSLGVLSVNALIAADQVLIPMQCEYFSLEGLSDIADTIRRLRDGWNPQLSVAGIIRSMLDSRNLLARDVSRELELHFGDKLFRTAIVRNVRLAEAPSHHLPIMSYAPHSNGAACFRELGNEFMERFA